MGTNFYDVHLGKALAVYKDEVRDARKHNYMEIGPEGFELQPCTLYLGVTEKYTETHNSVYRSKMTVYRILPWQIELIQA